MRTDKLFVVFGSDSRFEYTRKALEAGNRNAVSFDGSIPDTKKALVLPLPFSRDSKSVNCGAAERPVTLEDITASLKKDDLVFGGLLTDEFIAECRKKGALCFDYYDVEMILKNAVLTAESLLMLIDGLGFKKDRLKFAVTGFGRTAKAIAEAFEAEGLDFTVSARSDEAEISAKSMNFSFVKLKDFTDKSHEFDVIINTVPALIFDTKKLSALKPGATVIDVASAPFGVKKEEAEACNIKLVRALGLPGKYVPEKAGRLIADRIEYYLKGR